MRRWLIGIAVLVAIVLLAGGAYFYALKEAWIRYNEYDIRTEGTLRVGDLAPDLELQSADGSGPRKLSDLFQEKPLVLVFGSYT
jgi:hypothetical protein